MGVLREFNIVLVFGVAFLALLSNAQMDVAIPVSGFAGGPQTSWYLVNGPNRIPGIPGFAESPHSPIQRRDVGIHRVHKPGFAESLQGPMNQPHVEIHRVHKPGFAESLQEPMNQPHVAIPIPGFAEIQQGPMNQPQVGLYKFYKPGFARSAQRPMNQPHAPYKNMQLYVPPQFQVPDQIPGIARSLTDPEFIIPIGKLKKRQRGSDKRSATDVLYGGYALPPNIPFPNRRHRIAIFPQ